MNAKGDIFPLISWVGVVLVSLIVAYWYFSNFFIEKEPFERMENDLRNIRIMIDDACETKYYRATYNPFTEEGSLDANRSGLCIKTRNLAKCRAVLCEKLPEETTSLNLGTLINVVVEKKEEVVSIYAE